MNRSHADPLTHTHVMLYLLRNLSRICIFDVGPGPEREWGRACCAPRTEPARYEYTMTKSILHLLAQFEELAGPYLQRPHRARIGRPRQTRSSKLRKEQLHTRTQTRRHTPTELPHITDSLLRYSI